MGIRRLARGACGAARGDGGATRALALATQRAAMMDPRQVLGGAARRRMLTCWQGLAGSASAGSLRLGMAESMWARWIPGPGARCRLYSWRLIARRPLNCSRGAASRKCYAAWVHTSTPAPQGGGRGAARLPGPVHALGQSWTRYKTNGKWKMANPRRASVCATLAAS